MFVLFVLSYACIGRSQHIWYNDAKAGDILINDVMVVNTSTTTYYETLGWNQGSVAGGYTGNR